MIRAWYRGRMPRLLLALVAVLAAVPAPAEDAAALARRVHDPTVDAAPLAAALRSPDALARATAARVALVRGVAEALPALREAAANETHHDAAREEIRALVLLGTDDDVAFAAQQLPRHPRSIDGEFGDAIARIGGQRAVDLYFRYAPSLRMPAYDTLLMFWDDAARMPPAAARALAANDASFWKALLGRMTPPSDLALAGLRHDDAEVRIATLWDLVEHANDQPALIAAVREGVQPRDGASVEEAFARELLRRAAGETPREVPGAAAWIAAKDNEQRVGYTFVERLMSERERAARRRPEVPYVTIARDDPYTMTVDAPPFGLPLALPAGLGDALLRAAGCRGGWIGVAPVTVDRAGRVTAIDTANLAGEPACVDALRTAARLSLARPESITSARTAQLIFLRHESQPPCFDEDPLVTAAVPASAQRSGGQIRPPKVKRRVEPVFPQSVLRSLGPGQSIPLVIETVISSTGCYRSFRLVRQSKYPELNRSALEALSKWKFEPGALDGVPVDVIFYLTINFKSR